MLFLVAENSPMADNARFGSIFQLLGTLVLFIIVIVLCFFVTRFVGGRQLQKQQNSNFTVIDTVRLAQNRFLQIVQVGKRYFVIAVCKEQISLISEIQKEDITCWHERVQGGLSFQELLNNFKKAKTEKEVKVDTHENHEE